MYVGSWPVLYQDWKQTGNNLFETVHNKNLTFKYICMAVHFTTYMDINCSHWSVTFNVM